MFFLYDIRFCSGGDREICPPAVLDYVFYSREGGVWSSAVDSSDSLVELGPDQWGVCRLCPCDTSPVHHNPVQFDPQSSAFSKKKETKRKRKKRREIMAGGFL
jgi:hypothetical protein